MRTKWNGFVWTIDCVDNRTGRLVWSEKAHNDLLNQGERSIIMSYFRAEEVPAQFYIRLAQDSISLTDTLADIQREPVGNGYVPALLARSALGWPTVAQDSGDWVITSQQVQFTAAGGQIGPCNVAFLASTADNTGVLISCVPFDITRTINDGQTGLVTLSTRLK